MNRERPRFERAMADGDTDMGVVFAGEGLDLIQSVEPAAAVLERLVIDAERVLGHGVQAPVAAK